MTLHIESFFDGDFGKSGAILRAITPSSIATRTVFRMNSDGPMMLFDQVTQHPGDVFSWSEFTFKDSTNDVDVSGEQNGSAISVNGESTALPSRSIPGYAAHLVLTRLLQGDEESVRFRQFSETEPESLESAEFRTIGSESIEMPWGESVVCRKVQLVLDGKDNNAFWCRDGAVVKSDWCGAESYTTSDMEFLLDGLADDVCTAIVDFMKQTTVDR